LFDGKRQPKPVRFGSSPTTQNNKSFAMLVLARLTILTAMLACTSVAAIEIGELRSGVWAALQPEDNRFNDCNSLIVAADDYVIVVDAQESASDVGSRTSTSRS
jgi:hypothetical protein